MTVVLDVVKDKSRSLSILGIDIVKRITAFREEFEKLAIEDYDTLTWRLRSLSGLFGYPENDFSSMHAVVKKALKQIELFYPDNKHAIVETTCLSKPNGIGKKQEIVDYLCTLDGCMYLLRSADASKIEVMVANYVITEMRDAKLKGFASADGDKFNPFFAANAQLINGKEWWSGRWLSNAIGYNEDNWKNFNAVVNKVKNKHKRNVVCLDDTGNYVSGNIFPESERCSHGGNAASI